MYGLTKKFISSTDIQLVKHGSLFELPQATRKYPWFKEIVNESFQIQLGRGNTIRFWEDCWFGNFTLKDQFSRLYTITI